MRHSVCFQGAEDVLAFASSRLGVSEEAWEVEEVKE